MKMDLRTLNDSDIQQTRTALTRLFETVGFVLQDDDALEQFARRGADVDAPCGRVKLPAGLLEELIATAPRDITVCDMQGREICFPQSNRPALAAIVTDPWIIDPATGPRRPVLEDIRRNTILGQSLERVKIQMRMQFPVADIPGEESYLRSMETYLSHSAKHNLIMPTSMANTELWWSLNDAICEAAGLDPQQSPTMTVAMGVKSPLVVKAMNMQLIRRAMERNYPVYGTVCPMAGTTAPYSIAGTMLLSVAEALLPTIITQALKPGHPAWFTAGPSISDMATGHDLYYPIEKVKLKVAINQMGQDFGLPIMGETAGSLPWRHDVQTGFEGGLLLTAAHLGQQNVMAGLGSCHNANGMSGEMMLIQYAMIEAMDYLRDGLDPADLDEGLESIARVGPDGDYLTDEVTLKNLRSDEFLRESLFDRTGGYDPDAPGVVERATRRADEIVESYQHAVADTVREAITRWTEEHVRSGVAAG